MLEGQLVVPGIDILVKFLVIMILLKVSGEARNVFSLRVLCKR